MATHRRVASPDGTPLAVFEAGEPDRPTIVAVHGYPDNHTVWNGVAAILAEQFHVVTYDVRGSGESGKPAHRGDYGMPHLVADLAAVIDAVSPERPVHLLAHDWGSIQSWPAVTDPRLANRIRSFTSISGPSLDHAAAWMRHAHRHVRASSRQLLDSYYIALFQVPVLPEVLWRTGLPGRLLARTTGTGTGPRRTQDDALRGLQLYRANMLPRLSRPRPQRVEVPVQVLAPRDDNFVTVALQTQAPIPYVAHLRTREIAGGHWVLVDNPGVIADHTSAFVAEVERGA